MLKAFRFLAAGLLAFIVLNAAALADPYADLAQFGQAFIAVKAYHMTVTTDNGRTIEMDYVAPNKWHMVMGNDMESIYIDPDIWVHVRGNWMHVPGGMGAGRMQGLIANVRGAIPSGDYKNDYTVTDLGMKDGFHAYDVTHKSSADHSIIYLMPNNLPAKIEAFANGKKSTIVYSKFNASDITIAPPSQ